MKVLFLATPEFAVKFLDELKKFNDIILVVTRPDKPSGRGQKINPTGVKKYCLDNGLRVLTPRDTDEIIKEVKNLAPDIAVAVAYGKILKKDFFSVPKFGTVNVHFSLLPKYRGAAPIQWSLLNGETSGGVTVFEIDEGLDTGPVYKQLQTEITPDDNAISMREKLTDLGIKALKDVLSEIESGRAKKVSQKGVPSYAKALTKEDAKLDFNSPAVSLHNKIRGLALGPHPYVISAVKNKELRIQILKTELCQNDGGQFKPGMITRVERGLGFLVQCQDSPLMIREIRPEGKKNISAWDFFSGFNLKIGDYFCL
jgi:methionyl-tRNA formyltransferase